MGNSQLLSSSNYPSWNGTIDLSSGQDILWKCVKANEQTLEIIEWQSGEDNQFTTISGTQDQTASF